MFDTPTDPKPTPKPKLPVVLLANNASIDVGAVVNTFILTADAPTGLNTGDTISLANVEGASVFGTGEVQSVTTGVWSAMGALAGDNYASPGLDTLTAQQLLLDSLALAAPDTDDLTVIYFTRKS